MHVNTSERHPPDSWTIATTASPPLIPTPLHTSPSQQQPRTITFGGLLPSAPPTATADGPPLLTRPQPVRPQLSSSASTSSSSSAPSSYWPTVFGASNKRGSSSGGDVVVVVDEEQRQQEAVVVSTSAALAALEALVGFDWGHHPPTTKEEEAEGEDSSSDRIGLWSEVGTVLAAVGPRLLEAPAPEGNSDDEAVLLVSSPRLRVAAAMARGMRRLAAVAAAVAAVGDGEMGEEEAQQQERERVQRGLRASVHRVLQCLLDAAVAEVGREGRQALFAYVLMDGVEEEGEEHGDGDAGGGNHRCLDPFLAAPGPVAVLLQAARDEDLEVRA